MYRYEVMTEIAAAKVVAIIRESSQRAGTEAAERLVDAGLGVVEVAMTTPGALDCVEALRHDRDGAIVGAGTVLDAPTARLAILAGAQFLVSPGINPEVVALAHRYDVAVLPGAQTATEIVAAMTAGADAVKVFPASRVGPAGLADLRGPLPHVPFIPTGGIAVDDAASWLDAGAVAVGLGSSLSRGTPGEVAKRARRLVRSLHR